MSRLQGEEADGRSIHYWTGGVYDDVELITDAPRPPAVTYERRSRGCATRCRA
ncbi:hypothetical protein [Sorangium sp. So ce590]|uniref:hypothetical protein n=1 Tax=unclassified Sorangium TaxID=2621164 RepID=UPI003F606D48